MDSAYNGLITVAVALIGLATLAVVLSKNSNTSGVLTSAGSALSTGITAAVSPIAASTGLGSVVSPVESIYA